MTLFEIGILIGLAVVSALLWEIRDAIRKTHDRIVDMQIERRQQRSELEGIETLLSMIEHNTGARRKVRDDR